MPSHSEESNRPKNEQDKLETAPEIVHGSAGDQETSSKVPRADKTAPLPEHEHGGAIPGMAASGGGRGIKNPEGQGKGPLKPGV